MNPTTSRTVYCVLHLYKTAGSNLRFNFARNFADSEVLALYTDPMGLDKGTSPANPGWDLPKVQTYVAENATLQTRCLIGHMVYFGIHDLLGPGVDARYITFLRHPVERVISLYYHLRNQSQSDWHWEIVENDWSLEQWLTHSELLLADDGQTRQLLLGNVPGIERVRNLSSEHLEAAKRILAQFWFVGLQETFDHDANYIYGQASFRRFHPQARIYATPEKRSVDARLREMIAERNQLDLELYSYAQDMHRHFVENNRLSYTANYNRAKLVRILGRQSWLMRARHRLLRVVP